MFFSSLGGCVVKSLSLCHQTFFFYFLQSSKTAGRERMMKKHKKGKWTHLVCLPSYLWYKCIFPIWWYTDSEQQSCQWPTSICKGQCLYFKEMSPCGELPRSQESQAGLREREGRVGKKEKPFPSIQSGAIIHGEWTSVYSRGDSAGVNSIFRWFKKLSSCGGGEQLRCWELMPRRGGGGGGFHALLLLPT